MLLPCLHGPIDCRYDYPFVVRGPSMPDERLRLAFDLNLIWLYELLWIRDLLAFLDSNFERAIAAVEAVMQVDRGQATLHG